MQTEIADSEVIDLSEDDTVSWLEPLTPAFKKKRAFLALGIAVVLSAGLAWIQWRNDIPDPKAYAWGFVILAIGAWRFRAWGQKETVRKFQTTEKVLTKRQRLVIAAPMLALGFGGTGLMFGMQFGLEGIQTWPIGLVFLVIGLAGVLVYAFNRKNTVLTERAAKLKAFYEAPPTPSAEQLAKQSAIESKFEELVMLKVVRYPVAAGLLWLAYELADGEKPKWVLIGAAVIGALFAAHELFLWLVIAGLVVGVLALGFNVMAALPVSVAVIIGALIIAGAIKK